MMSDTDLLRRYATDRDETAFTEFVQRNLPVVYATALRRLNGDAHLAEDAAQVVFTQIACKAQALSRHPALLGWMYTSARFAASAISRRELRRLQRETSASAMRADVSDSPDWEALRPFLDDTLEQLGERDRHAIILRFFAGRSYLEIGSELRVSEEAARKCVDRALGRLHAALAQRGITTCAGALATAMTTAQMLTVSPAVAGQIASVAMTTASAMGVGAGAASAAAGMAGATKTSMLALSVISLATTVIVGGGGVTLARAQREQQRQLAAVEAQAAGFHSRLVALHREPSRLAVPATPTTTQDKEPAHAKPDPSVASMIENLRAWEKLAGDPGYAAVRDQEFRMRVQREFGAFLAARQYSSKQQAFLRRTLVAYYDAIERIVMKAQVAGVTGQSDWKTAKSEDQKAIQGCFEALGSQFTQSEVADIRRCFDAQQQMPAAANAARQLAFNGTPLDELQVLSLAMILADADATSRSPAERTMRQTVDGKDGLSPQDRMLLEDAGAFLSTEQLRRYEGYLRAEHVRWAIADRIRQQVSVNMKP